MLIRVEQQCARCPSLPPFERTKLDRSGKYIVPPHHVDTMYNYYVDQNIDDISSQAVYTKCSTHVRSCTNTCESVCCEFNSFLSLIIF